MKTFKILILFVIASLISNMTFAETQIATKQKTLSHQHFNKESESKNTEPVDDNDKQIGLDSLGKSEVMLLTQYHVRYIFNVEIAKSLDDKIKGLAGRSSLPKNSAMLFHFDQPEIITMWMKDTIFPLDMLFIAENGRIVKIHRRAVPFSITPISSDVPVIAVMEIQGGLADEYRLAVGDLVLHQLLF